MATITQTETEVTVDTSTLTTTTTTYTVAKQSKPSSSANVHGFSSASTAGAVAAPSRPTTHSRGIQPIDIQGGLSAASQRELRKLQTDLVGPDPASEVLQKHRNRNPNQPTKEKTKKEFIQLR